MRTLHKRPRRVRIYGAPAHINKILTMPRQAGDMSNYIRPRVPGAAIFFTVYLSERGSDALVRHVDLLRAAVRQTKSERPFQIDAWVTLPDHLHCVWRLPPGDTEYSTRWSVIKARFSRAMPHGPRRDSHVKRREHGLWQRRFWEHHIRGPAEHRHLIRYCWMNPVKHGLVSNPGDWNYSSYHRDRMEQLTAECAVGAAQPAAPSQILTAAE